MNENEIIEHECDKLIYVTSESAGERIDRFLSSAEDISRSRAADMIEKELVLVNEKRADKKLKLKEGDILSVSYPQPQCDRAEPEDIPLDIIYEDSDIIVINKPTGMIVHPATGIYTGTLVNALMYHCKDSLSGIGGVIRPGIVHRIDKDTSGLLVVAKNDAAHLSLSEQLKTHTVSRVYYAITVGNIKEDSGTINKPIGRHPSDRKKMAVILDPSVRSREAITHFSVLERFVTPKGRYTLVQCRLETGRTHQIRVHMASIGHPLLGDGAYGGDKSEFERTNKDIIEGQCLHAGQLELIHPSTGALMHFECPLPENMKEIINKLEKQTAQYNDF